MEGPLISVIINKRKITSFEYNDIVKILDGFKARHGDDSVNVIVYKKPLWLTGGLSYLSIRAKQYFDVWKANDCIRHIGIVKGSQNAQEKH